MDSISESHEHMVVSSKNERNTHKKQQQDEELKVNAHLMLFTAVQFNNLFNNAVEAVIQNSVKKTKNSIIKLHQAKIPTLTTSQFVGYRLITKLNFLINHITHFPAKYSAVLKKLMQQLRQKFRNSLLMTQKVALQYKN